MRKTKLKEFVIAKLIDYAYDHMEEKISKQRMLMLRILKILDI